MLGRVSRTVLSSDPKEGSVRKSASTSHMQLQWSCVQAYSPTSNEGVWDQAQGAKSRTGQMGALVYSPQAAWMLWDGGVM